MTETPVVLHVTRASARDMAGCGKSLSELLSAYFLSRTQDFAMSAAFADRQVNSYESLEPLANRWPTPTHFPANAGITVHLWWLYAGFAYLLSTLRLLFRLRNPSGLYKRGSVVLHGHDLVAPLLCILRFGRRYPLVVTVHGKGGVVTEALHRHPRLRGTLVEALLRRAEKAVIQRASIVTFPSRGAMELMLAEYSDALMGADTRVIHHGIDARQLDSVPTDPASLRKYGIADGQLVVLCVGHLITEKGIDVLLEAICDMPDDIGSKLACLVVGEGHLRQQLESFIADQGLQDRVKLVGLLPHDEVVKLMKSATIFVLPSRANVFDYALLEAGAIGLPIVTTAVGGNLEMFDDESAILVSPEDHKGLAAAIVALVSDHNLRRKLGESARHRIRTQFSPERMLESYVAMYKELVTAFPSARGPLQQ